MYGSYFRKQIFKPTKEITAFYIGEGKCYNHILALLRPIGYTAGRKCLPSETSSSTLVIPSLRFQHRSRQNISLTMGRKNLESFFGGWQQSVD